MSIVRIGLGETKGYHDGYDAIFKKKPAKAAAAPAKKAAPVKKPAAKAAKKK
jgi:hypothetical protein